MKLLRDAEPRCLRSQFGRVARTRWVGIYQVLFHVTTVPHTAAACIGIS